MCLNSVHTNSKHVRCSILLTVRMDRPVSVNPEPWLTNVQNLGTSHDSCHTDSQLKPSITSNCKRMPTTRMDTSRPRQCNRTPSLDMEVMIHERRKVALLVFRSMLTLPLQLQSVLNSPSIETNEVIPESEQSRVESLLQDIVSELGMQVRHAQEYILLLQDKRAGYVEDMKKLRPSIAPDKYLPLEILIEIFLQYAAEIAEEVKYTTASMDRRLSQFPWVLGRICSRWRQIALAEPRIWGTIGFNATNHDNLPMLSEAFRRGGQSRLWLSASEDVEKYKYVEFLRDIVCSQSKRITDLSLSIFEETFEEFLTLPSDSFPVLEAFQLDMMEHLYPWPGSDASIFQGATRLRRIDIGTSLAVTLVSFPMNLCLCWPQLTHINFSEISIQVSIAHELMKLCTNLGECHIRLEENWNTLSPVWIKSHPPSSIPIPYLWRLEIHQEDGVYIAFVFNEFLRPLVMPNLQQFSFSLQEEPSDIVSTLTELTTIVDGLSRPNLVSEMSYLDDSGLTEVTSALPFVTSLKVRALTDSTIRTLAQKDHLPILTSLEADVEYADMDTFINMLETRWVRGIEAQLSGCSTAGIIQSAKICVAYVPRQESVSRLSWKVCEIQDRLKMKGAMISVELEGYEIHINTVIWRSLTHQNKIIVYFHNGMRS